MSFLRYRGNTGLAGVIRGPVKTAVASPRPVNYSPVVTSDRSTNQLTPGGSVVTAPVRAVPKETSLNNTGTSFNKPTPPGGVFGIASRGPGVASA